MASINREQAQRRIAQDDGDGTDRVYLPRGNNSTVECYHEREDCYTLRHTTTCDAVMREQAQQQGKAPCKVCVLGNVEKNHGQSLAARLQQMDPEDAGLSPHLPPGEDDECGCDGSGHD